MAAAFLFRALVLPGLLVLAGCGGTGPTQAETGATVAGDPGSSDTLSTAPPGGTVAMVPPVDVSDPSDCNGPAAERFIGRQADEVTRRELAAAVAPVSDIRWVAPGDATTEDYRSQRLNVMLDMERAIASVHCG